MLLEQMILVAYGHIHGCKGFSVIIQTALIYQMLQARMSYYNHQKRRGAHYLFIHKSCPFMGAIFFNPAVLPDQTPFLLGHSNLLLYPYLISLNCFEVDKSWT